MNILKKAAVFLAAIIVLLVVVGVFFLPSKRHSEHSIMIEAPVSAIFQEVNHLKRWENWSPSWKLDPNMKIEYAGPEEGVGSTASWASRNFKVGKGIQKIIASEPNKRVVFDFQVTNRKGTSIAIWKFEEKSEGRTQVTWISDIDNKGNLIYKYEDAIIYSKLEKLYEQGLQNLKTYVERLQTEQIIEAEEGTGVQ